MNSQCLGGEKRYVNGGILNLTLVDGIVVGGVDQQRHLRGYFAIHQLGGSIDNLIVFVPLQSGWGIATSGAALQF